MWEPCGGVIVTMIEKVLRRLLRHRVQLTAFSDRYPVAFQLLVFERRPLTKQSLTLMFYLRQVTSGWNI